MYRQSCGGFEEWGEADGIRKSRETSVSARTSTIVRLIARLERNPEAAAAVRATLLRAGASLHLFQCHGSDPQCVELYAEISLPKPQRLPRVLDALEALRRVAIMEAGQASYCSGKAGYHFDHA